MMIKQKYESPATTVVEVKTRGFLCQSPVNAALILGLNNGSPTDGLQNYENGGDLNW